MEEEGSLSNAARTVLTHCLALPPGADVVVFADETTADIAWLFVEQADALGLHPLLAYFGSQAHRQLAKQPLHPGLMAAMDEAAAVLVCLSGAQTSYEFRDKVRAAAFNNGCKVGHMPGIDAATLRVADVDYDALRGQCELLATVLLKSNVLDLVSYDAAGHRHCLTVPLDPTSFLPITSDGIIQKGSWGNIPSGETFIAPPPTSGDGSIVINGSIRGYVMAPGEELILTFKGGELTRWSPEDSPAARHFVAEVVTTARAEDDKEWNRLAEVGLGVNPRVERLTGSMLLDEKKYGTIHVALGDNTDMGGHNRANVHYDMVTLSPEVTADGRLIIGGGRLQLTAAEWREDLATLAVPAGWTLDKPLLCTAVQANPDDQGRLRRSWDTDSGRVCSVIVGNDDAARTAAVVYQALYRQRQPATLRALPDSLLAGDETRLIAAAYLLSIYGLLRPAAD